MTVHRSQRFLDIIREVGCPVIIAHDNPDPDAIAAGWGLVTLLKDKLNLTPRFVAGGAIVRAENRCMVSLLNPPLELTDQADLDPETPAVFVDCEPANANHLVEGAGIRPVAVIDHHQHQTQRQRVRHRDIRTNVAASATIVTIYLREQGVRPSSDLATALLYGIYTDAAGWPPFSSTDHRAIIWLTHCADLSKLADIQSAPLSRSYYADLLLALENTFLYEGTAICFLPQAGGAEIVGEVADLLIRAHDVTRVLCAAVVGGDIVVSVRTTPAGGAASDLVAAVVAGRGRGGGHLRRAGGKISSSIRTDHVGEDLQAELRTKWLKACGIEQQRGDRLVPRREILENL